MTFDRVDEACLEKEDQTEVYVLFVYVDSTFLLFITGLDKPVIAIKLSSVEKSSLIQSHDIESPSLIQPHVHVILI